MDWQEFFEAQRQAELEDQRREIGQILLEAGVIDRELRVSETEIARAAAFALLRHDGDYFLGSEVFQAMGTSTPVATLKRFSEEFNLTTAAPARTPSGNKTTTEYAPTELGQKVFAVFTREIELES
jgi:hypothetical protein